MNQKEINKEFKYNILKIIVCGKLFDNNNWTCGDFLEQEQTDEGEWMGECYFCPECHKKAEEVLRTIQEANDILIKEELEGK